MAGEVELSSPPPGDLPVFLGTSWEDHTSQWRSSDEEVNVERWKQAAVAASLRGRYGKQAIPKFAADVNSSASRVFRYAATYLQWAEKRRSEILSFHHHTIAAHAKDPEKAIEAAEVEEWSTRQLEAAIHEERTTGRLELPESYGEEVTTTEALVVLEEGVRLCPHCRGRGTVPDNANQKEG